MEMNRPSEANGPSETGRSYIPQGVASIEGCGATGVSGAGEITAPGGLSEASETPQALAAHELVAQISQVYEVVYGGEVLDVVDQDGNPTGIRIDKNDIHTNGLWHRDVHVWVTDGTNILEQRRALDKSIMPGAWDISASGHVGAGESYEAAACRETLEEMGIELTPRLLLPAGMLSVEMAMEGGAWVHRTVGDNFVVVIPDLRLNDLALQASEVIDARLYPIGQLEADVHDPQKAAEHAAQPLALWQLGISAMRRAATERRSRS
jgi:isopentenyldiphosphate isomerase